MRARSPSDTYRADIPSPVVITGGQCRLLPLLLVTARAASLSAAAEIRAPLTVATVFVVHRLIAAIRHPSDFPKPCAASCANCSRFSVCGTAPG